MMRPIRVLGFSSLMVMSCSSWAADNSCLEYEPSLVTLVGRISSHLEYGPPGYGEDPAHDEHEVYWYLDLDKPICTLGKNEVSPEMEGEQNVQRLQIVYMRDYPAGGRIAWVGRRVTIIGTLFHGITGHHHTRVLITANETVKLP